MSNNIGQPALPRYMAVAWETHGPAAEQSLDILKTYAPNLPRVPGCDTALRLAVRIENGRTPVEAAAKEYAYRWRLALDAFDASATRSRRNPFAGHYAPHALGL